MKRLLVVVGACLLTAASPLGFVVSAQTDTPVNADGTYVVANDDGAPIASGAGQDIIYGDINTGGGGGEVLGDPSAVYAPALPAHPGPDGGVIMMPGAGDGMIGGVPVMPIVQPTGMQPIGAQPPGAQPTGTQPVAPDETATTTAAMDSTAGTTSENVPVESVSDAPAPESTESATTDAGFCAGYATWYEAQVAYESLGATGADSALVQEVDPDFDGIACEAMMA